MKRSKRALNEAESYLAAAQHNFGRLQSQKDAVWNPVAVDCIMAIIKTVDAAMLKYRGKSNNDHSKTANELKQLYEDGLISESFKSNLDSVNTWVVDKKTDIQYRDESISKTDAERIIKATERLLKKMKTEIG